MARKAPKRGRAKTLFGGKVKKPHKSARGQLGKRKARQSGSIVDSTLGF